MRAADVIVIGAGPGGCAAALAHARDGAEVLLLDALSTPIQRLAGEWLHPAGVDALRRLGVVLPGGAYVTVRGFVVHPEHDMAPVPLPFPDRRCGIAVRYPVLVSALRRAAACHPRIRFHHPARVQRVTDNGVTLAGSGQTQSASRLIAADGKASVITQAAEVTGSTSRRRSALSRTAGLELTMPAGVNPIGTYGEVLLGGPGPVLLYRSAPDTVRLALDVPLAHPRGPVLADYLIDRYGKLLPLSIREPAIDALRTGRVQWATNGYRRRRYRCRPGWAIVGDAAGYSHPIAATGLTLALTDAEQLARSSLADYAQTRQRATAIPDRLALALHQLFSTHTPDSQTLLRGLCRVWATEAGRDRTMRLLTTEETSTTKYVMSILQTLIKSVGSTPPPRRGGLRPLGEEMIHAIAGGLRLLGVNRRPECSESHVSPPSDQPFGTVPPKE